MFLLRIIVPNGIKSEDDPSIKNKRCFHVVHLCSHRDCPDVDIVGSNLYQHYIDRLISRMNLTQETDKESRLAELIDPDLPMSRNVPPSAHFYPQTVVHMKSILVCTGVYKPDVDPEPGTDDANEKNYEGDV